MIQAAFVFTRYQLVTDRRTDSAAIPKSRASIPTDDIQKQTQKTTVQQKHRHVFTDASSFPPLHQQAAHASVFHWQLQHL